MTVSITVQAGPDHAALVEVYDSGSVVREDYVHDVSSHTRILVQPGERTEVAAYDRRLVSVRQLAAGQTTIGDTAATLGGLHG